jgi:hypothetical protein
MAGSAAAPEGEADRIAAVSKATKTLERVLRGNADANIRFRDLCALLHHLGFTERVRGDHHIFTRDGVVEILNLQPRGAQAKAYQVKQVRGVIVSYRLAGEAGPRPRASEAASEAESSDPAREDEDDR